MNKNPEISVLMSTYNSDEVFLKAAVDSIINQTYTNFEFIIIIDGIDRIAESVLSSYDDRRIRIIRNEINLGLTKSLNKGLKISRGKYIARMDSDDISFSRRLEKQYMFMEKEKNVVVCGSYAKNIGTKGFVTQLMSNNSAILDVRLMFYNAGIIHPTAFIRKDFMKKNEILYNEKIKKSQDYELWTDVIKFGDIKILPKVLLGYRRHKNQIINSASDDVIMYTNIIRIKQWERLGLIFSEDERELLKSISATKIDGSAKQYHELFNKLSGWNESNKYFNRRYLNAEINRLWFHMGAKKFIKNQKNDMFFHLRTLSVLKPYDFFYMVNFYIIDRLRPYVAYFSQERGEFYETLK